MANLAGTIRDAIDSTVGTTVGATYQSLRRVYSPEENDFRNIAKAYGVRFGSASPVDQILNAYTVDHDFDVLITGRAVNRQDDADIQTTLTEIYDQIDDITVELTRTKIGLPLIVMTVGVPTISAPEFFENEVVLITATYAVRYRQALK